MFSFSVNRGELVCVMGASGSGKSTLMKVRAASSSRAGPGPLERSPLIKTGFAQRLHQYIPQEDAFDEHLTIGRISIRRRHPRPASFGRDLTRRLEGKLIELGLNERRDSIVAAR